MRKLCLLNLLLFVSLLVTAQTAITSALKTTDAALYPRVAAISDIHVGRSGWEDKVKTALTILTQQTPKLDAIFIVGDITENGKSDEFQQTKTKIDEWRTDIPVYYLLGNHDWWGPRKGDNINAAEVFRNVFGQEVNQYIIIKDYPFILLSMETQDQANAYQATTRAFLSEKLSEAATAYPGKPIFVFQHVPNSGTVYGSYEIGGGDAWGTDNIHDILKQYPQVVSISGHSHFFLADERSIHQDSYTSVNDGSIAYAETETGLEGGTRPKDSELIQEGVVISLDANNDVTVERYNLRNNVSIKQPWVIKAPHDGSVFTYKNRDGGDAPYFENGAQVQLNSISDTYVQVSFPVAKDDDVVQHYRIEVLDANKALLPAPIYKILSKFYLYQNTEQTVSLSLTGLEKDTEYYVQVTAVDAFGKETTPPLLSEKFRTKNYTQQVVEAPEANLIDVKFQTDSVFNRITNSSLVVGKGPGTDPQVVYDSGIRQYVSAFTRPAATTQTYYKIDYKDNTGFTSAISQAFTFEVYTRTKGTAEMSSVSSLQSGGFGLEQVSGGKETKFWLGSASSSSDVKKIGNKSTYSSTDYYHIVITFDGTDLIIYYNGEPDGTAQLPDGIRLSSSTSAHWIAIGGDANTNENAQGAFDGEVALFRMYDKAISRDEVNALYKQLTTRKSIQEFDDLHDIISQALPDFQQSASEDLAAQAAILISEGWGLMNSYSTTLENIEDFLTRAKTTMGIAVPVYGENLFENPGFELSSNVPAKITVNPSAAQYPGRWNLTVTTAGTNDGDVTVVSDVAQEGNSSMRVDLREIDARYRFYLSYDIENVEPGKYQYSFYAKAGVSGVPFRVEMISYDAVGTKYDLGENLFSTGSSDGIEKQTDTDWVKYTFDIDLSDKTAEELSVLRFCIRPNCYQGGSVSKTQMTYWFDNFSFRRLVATSGIRPSEANDRVVHIYPNPVKAGDNLFVETDFDGNSFGSATAKLYNLSGMMIKKTDLTDNRASMRMPAAPGVYILVVSDGKTDKRLKLIVR